MASPAGKKHTSRSDPTLVVIAALAGWLIPGGGYWVLGDGRRATVVCITILITFVLGLYVGSIGVIDTQQARYWYAAQVMTSPAVILIGNMTRSGQFPVYGRPYEIGQIYTSIAGLLNLLCIINAAYRAYRRAVPIGQFEARSD
ncbi:MAG: hypothetical protein QHH07_00660 [Sedimentisphaerales bacterium]|nr:hypothetical protein [Sedimentisphaerales bacterium]